MVQDHYQLNEQPFGATPDSRFLFASETHREALATLLYGIEAGRGFMALIAKPGMGKTTLLFRSLTQLREKGRTVFLFQTISTPLDFLRTLLADLGVDELQGGMFELQSKLNQILVEQRSKGERLVVVIDETQNLDDSVLELVRMLSNFETPDEKLIQIVLSGQPQLARKLASPNLVQLRQRISVIAHLRPLTVEDTKQYIEHRLQVAGYESEQPLFTSAAVDLIARHSEGIPRNINNLCFNSMSIGAALKKKKIDADIVREVIADLDLDPLTELTSPLTGVPAVESATPPRPSRRAVQWIGRMALASCALLALSGLTMRMDGPNRVLAAGTARQPTSPLQVPLADIFLHAHLAPAQKPSPVPASSVPPSAAGPFIPQLKRDDQNRILVPVGMTLSEICSDTLPNCHSRELNEIQQLNPWLTNPNHLESGRKLRLPSPAGSLATETKTAKGVEEVTTQ
jgi:type II secretory pathway predicted ATPase ExeA